LRWRGEAERELRKLDHRIHHRTQRGKAGGTVLEALTSRELQVARLVVDRKTNPQIAAELFLSQKTVETHLRNIFHEVDVSSRVELARCRTRREQRSLTCRCASPGLRPRRFRDIQRRLDRGWSGATIRV
jgi:DNA-binding NarL/FixJ family response regulator